MPEPRTRFPPTEQAASAQPAPYRLRLLAFVLDASMLILVLIVGGLASVLGQYALDFGVSALSVALLALAVLIGFGVMNAMLAYLTDGQTLGKASCGLIERRRANGPDIGDAATLTRLMGRHTLGYLVIDPPLAQRRSTTPRSRSKVGLLGGWQLGTRWTASARVDALPKPWIEQWGGPYPNSG